MRVGLEGKVKIAIADDHGIPRSGLKMLIDAQPDMQVVGEASRVGDIPAVLNRTGTDVLVLDLGMPEGRGFNALKQIQASFPETKVIILTMHSDVALARAALAAGAAGFVLKQSPQPELFSAIRAAYSGGVYIDPSIAQGIISAAGTKKPGAAKLLSDREQQVLQLVAQGYSNHEIAGRIHLSTKTVETYRTRIGEKLGLRTRAEITRYALITGLLSAEQMLNE